MRRMNTCVWHKWPARSRAYLIIYICSLFIGSSLSVFGVNIDSLYTAAMSDNTISVLEAKHLLELLVAEEYAEVTGETEEGARRKLLYQGKCAAQEETCAAFCKYGQDGHPSGAVLRSVKASCRQTVC